MCIARSCRRQRLGIERLEARQLLAAGLGEDSAETIPAEGLLTPIIEFKLDVTQNGQSILDQDRVFNVNVGDEFDLEIQYSDLRSEFARLGASGFAVNILANVSSAYVPVVTERQFFEFSQSLAGSTGGSVLVGVEGSGATIQITYDELVTNLAPAFAAAAESLLELSSGNVTTTFFESQRIVSFDFLDDSLALTDVPNLTIDTSGLTGATVIGSSRQEPAFVDGDPSKGVNPQTFRTAIDFHSRSLDGLEFYEPVAGGGVYRPGEQAVFLEMLGFGPFTDLATFAADNNIPFDGIDFEFLSIRVKALEPTPNVVFNIAPIDASEGDFVYMYGELDVLTQDQLLFDVTDDPTISGDDRFAIVTGIFGEAPATPFQNPTNRFDVDGDGSVTGLDGLRVIQELDSRTVSASDGTLPSPPPDPIPAFFDVNGDNLVTRDDVDDLLEHLGQVDFGDAPSSTQSGFVSSYPTLLSDDGARHITTALFLGSGVSEDADGSPQASADGDSQDDGVIFLSSVAVDGSTAEVSIEASEVGLIDAWIDFNLDGDWSDAGEQIFDDLAVTSGTATYTFDISGGATVGTTFARFRLSSDGVDSPTGRASDGEVEDYALEIIEEAGDPRNPVVEFSGSITILNFNGNVVISDATGEIFNQPLDQLDSLTVTGSDGDDRVTYDQGGGSFVPSLGLTIDGAGGQDSLIVIGGANIDATAAGLVSLQNLPVLDMVGADASTLRLDGSVIAGMSPVTKRLLYSGNADDKLDFADATDWRMGDPINDGDDFWLTAVNQVTAEEIIAEVPTVFTNLIDASDINNDGKLSALDALTTIIELGRRVFSATEVGTVVDPASLDPFPDIYADQNGDLKVTALDALRIINEMARRALLDGESEIATPFIATLQSSTDALAEGANEFEALDTLSGPSKSLSLGLLQGSGQLAVSHRATLERTAAMTRPDASDSSPVDCLFEDEPFLESLG